MFQMPTRGVQTRMSASLIWASCKILMPEFSRFLRDWGGWEGQSRIMRKGRGEPPPSPFSLPCSGFPPSAISQEPREFLHKICHKFPLF